MNTDNTSKLFSQAQANLRKKSTAARGQNFKVTVFGDKSRINTNFLHNDIRRENILALFILIYNNSHC